MDNDKLFPIHPGEVLLEEFIKPMGLSQNRQVRDWMGWRPSTPAWIQPPDSPGSVPLLEDSRTGLISSASPLLSPVG